MTAALRRLFTVNLGVRRGAEVLVLADVGPGRWPVTALAAEAANAIRDLGRVRFAAFSATGRNGLEPSEPAWTAAFGSAAARALVREGLLEPLLAKRATPRQIRRAHAIIRARRADAVDAALFLTVFSATHTRFRALLTDAAGAAVASAPGFEARMFGTSMAIDWSRMKARTERVAGILRTARSVRITNPDGTDLRFSIAGRPCVPDTGFLKPGRFGNLPAGEAFVAPVEGTGEGRLSARSGPRGVFRGGIAFTVRRSRVTAVAGGGAEGRRLAAAFKAHPEFGVIAEFGVGTNEGARILENILEAEKILGTIHVAFGDNATFGGKNRAAFHQDFLVHRPTVDLDLGRGRTRRLLDRGRLL